MMLWIFVNYLVHRKLFSFQNQTKNQTSKQARNLKLVSFFVEYVRKNKGIHQRMSARMLVVYVRLALLVTVTIYSNVFLGQIGLLSLSVFSLS